MYPNLSSTCHIKLKCFLWTKLLENLLLAKYLTPVAAPLRNRTYLGKTLFFNFSGANFVTLKNGHRCEKQPVLGSDCWIWANKCLQGLKNGSFRQYICFQYLEETYCIYSLFTSHKVAKGYIFTTALQKDKSNCDRSLLCYGNFFKKLGKNKNKYTLKIMKILRTASLGSNFTGSYKKRVY